MNAVYLPSTLIDYLVDAYSKLTGFIHTSEWDSGFFPLQRGIFQGDPLSPHLFLLVFAPVIGIAEASRYLGYQPTFSIPQSQGLPPKDSYIYLHWDEENSEEPEGWYKCKIDSYSIQGLCLVEYVDGQTEQLDLWEHNWMLAGRNSKAYRSNDNVPPIMKMPKVRKEMEAVKHLDMTPHQSKAFADDLTVISIHKDEHQRLLQSLHHHCSEIDLIFNPSKCVSLCFDGKACLKNTTFKLGDGSTQNVISKPIKFLGKMLGHSRRETMRAASSKIKDILLPALQRITEANVRGEYKVWVYQHYLMPSLNFHLTVNDISRSQTLSLQRMITRHLKSWLDLPRCLTPAVLFHTDGIGLAHLPTLFDKAKASLLMSVTMSSDSTV